MPQHFKVREPYRPHFITNTVVHWIPVFVRDDYFRLLSDSFGYCAENKGLRIHAYVVMPNHFHAVCSQADGHLSEVIRDLKKHTSKRIAEMLEQDGRRLWLTSMRRAAGNTGGVKVWDEAFHPEQVHSRPFAEQKIRYLHDNPVRAGFVSDPCEWKCSSAGFYYRDLESSVPVVPIEW